MGHCRRTEEEASSLRRYQRKKGIHFFKIIHRENIRDQKLEIPKGFMKHFKGVTSGSVCTLMGPSGSVWKVSLTVDVGNGLFLGEGWAVFVKDHFIQPCDFLFFRYDGSLHFEVKIFDITACAKESAFDAVCSQVTSTATPDGKKKFKAVCSQVTSTAIPDGKKKFKAVCSQVTSTAITNGKKKANQAKHSRWDFVSMEEAVAEAADRRGGLLSQRRHVRMYETEKAKEAANKFTSENPFFIIVMRASHVYFGFSVTIPSSFWRAHLPKCSQDMTLWDPKGRAWRVHYHFIGTIRVVLSRGWVAFTESNNIEAEDVCVFELVQEYQMKVHIFRVVEEIRPLIKNTRTFREGA